MSISVRGIMRKYASLDQTRAALAASGAEIVTVALRRIELAPGKPSLLDAIDRSRYVLLPNTAGCFDVESALRTARVRSTISVWV